MKTQTINRVESALLQWKEKEEKFSKLFSFEMSSNKALLAEKLRDYERISLRYSGTKDPAERFTQRMLRQEISYMEKKLNPNLTFRLIRRLFIKPVQRYLIRRNLTKQKEEKVQSLLSQTKRFGMEKESSEAVKMMSQGISDFSLTSSKYMGENERLENTLTFKENKAISLKTILYDDASGVSRQHTFNLVEYPKIGTEETYNLLVGRSVLQDEKWLKLDQNDRDLKGNYKLQQTPNNAHFLERSLIGLPFKELLLDSNREKIIAELEKGNQVALTSDKSGKINQFFIEANPTFNTVSVFDRDMLQTTMAEVLGKKQIQRQKQNQEIQPAKRSRLKIVN